MTYTKIVLLGYILYLWTTLRSKILLQKLVHWYKTRVGTNLIRHVLHELFRYRVVVGKCNSSRLESKFYKNVQSYIILFQFVQKMA